MGRVEVRVERCDPLISIVIPSRDGARGGNVARLLADLRRQTRQDFEVILAIGFSPNGHARNQGVKQARGKYLVCIDDDVTLGHERVLENLLRPFEIADCGLRNPGVKCQVSGVSGDKSAIRNSQSAIPVGMTGPSQQLPPDSTRFQWWAARQLPRTLFPIVDEITDADMVSHMCLCMPTQLYKDVGWENDEIVRGTDTDLRYRVRQAGYRIVVVPQTWAYHPIHRTMRGILRDWFNKGRWTAFNRRKFPGFHFEAPDGAVKEFVPLRGKGYRAARFVGRFVVGLLTLKWVGVLTQVAYVLGYVRGQFFESSYK